MTDRAVVLAVDDREPSIDPSAFLAPGATVVGSVQLGPRVGIWYGAVLRADSEQITVGAETNLQDGVIVHSDPGLPAVLGERVTVGHGAVVHGAVVEDDCLIGMRATVLNGVRVGAGSLVAAGAVVTEGTEIPPGSLVAGVPAKVKRPLTDVERARVADGYQEYLAKAEQHGNTARPVQR